MTRGRLLDRIKVALAGHVAVRVVLGQETNTSQPGVVQLARTRTHACVAASCTQITYLVSTKARHVCV